MSADFEEKMISLICAMGRNREIGVDNGLPWHISMDLKRFKKLTMGHPIIMGRRTFESIGRPLPGRRNIIITRDLNYRHPLCMTVHSIEEAIKCALADEKSDPPEIFIIGGGQIYRQTITMADKLYFTLVDDAPERADTFFPEYKGFCKVSEEGPFNEKGLTFRFVEMIR